MAPPNAKLVVLEYPLPSCSVDLSADAFVGVAGTLADEHVVVQSPGTILGRQLWRGHGESAVDQDDLVDAVVLIVSDVAKSLRVLDKVVVLDAPNLLIRLGF